ANTSFSWHSDHLTTSGSLHDLYGVGLHEMMHVLGFASLISSTGVSKFGAANNYYTTYDQFLKNPAGSNLITTTHTCSQQYGHAFTGGTVNLQPGCPGSYTADVTTCSVACTYSSPNVSTNIAVYTPGCYDGGGGS